MKKIKFMLLSLALLAVVGGALAFKAKYINDFCTADAIVVNGVSTCIDAAGVTLKCPNQAAASQTAVGGFFCTTTRKNGLCPNTLTCLTTTYDVDPE